MTLTILKVFLVHHQLKFSKVLVLNFRVYTQYAALSTPLTVCVYISSFVKFAYFLSLFQLVNILSKQFNAFKAYILLLR